MTPDLPLFVRQVVPSYSTTHDLTAIALTLLIALALLLLWRCLLRPAAAHLLPGFIGERLPAEWQQSTRATLRETFGGGSSGGTTAKVFLLLVSLAVGIVSHVVWDSFTHEGRQAYAWLDASWGPLPAFKWLQHGSSLIGLAIISIWGLAWLRRRPRVALEQRVPRWVRTGLIIALPVCLIVAAVWGFIIYGPLTAEWTLAHLAYRVLPPACAVWAALTVAVCVAVAVRQPRATLRTDGISTP